MRITLTTFVAVILALSERVCHGFYQPLLIGRAHHHHHSDHHHGRAANMISNSAGDESPLTTRDLRARLIAKGLNGYGSTDAPQMQPKWAHRLAHVEQGCLLLAADIDDGSIFEKSVIFILEHNSLGTSGLILNRPTNFTMGEKTASNIVKLRGMENNVLYNGGLVGRVREDGLDVINFMHGFDDIPGDEVIKGVKLGGLPLALKRVGEGKADPTAFKFFARYTGWLPGQLQAEIQRGAWIVAACDVGTVLENHDDVDEQPYKLWDEIHARIVQSQYKV